MLVIGIDPGSLNTGFAWIRDGEKKVENRSTFFKSMQKMPHRWIELRDKLERQLLLLPEPPAMVVVEEPCREGHQKGRPDNRKALMQFFGCYSVIVAEVSRLFRNTSLVPVKYMSWTGGMDKGFVYNRLAQKYGRNRWTCDDEADAMGLADFGWEALTRNRGNTCRSEKEILYGSFEKPNLSPTTIVEPSSGDLSEKPVSPTIPPLSKAN